MAKEEHHIFLKNMDWVLTHSYANGLKHTMRSVMKD